MKLFDFLLFLVVLINCLLIKGAEKLHPPSIMPIFDISESIAELKKKLFAAQAIRRLELLNIAFDRITLQTEKPPIIIRNATSLPDIRDSPATAIEEPDLKKALELRSILARK